MIIPEQYQDIMLPNYQKIIEAGVCPLCQKKLVCQNSGVEVMLCQEPASPDNILIILNCHFIILQKK